MFILKHSYLLNVIFVVLHEMDAVYWKEWGVFGFADDETGMKIFVLAHIPLLFLLLWGMLRLHKRSGQIISLMFSTFFAFHSILHVSALKENLFNGIVSFGIISAILFLSLVQLAATLLYMKRSKAQGYSSYPSSSRGTSMFEKEISITSRTFH